MEPRWERNEECQVDMSKSWERSRTHEYRLGVFGRGEVLR